MGLTQVSEKGIKDGEILNADINASAAIAGSKISPDFGSQNIVTTGTLTANNINANSGLDISIISGTVSAIFPNSSQVNGITGMPSQSGTPFVVAKDTGTNRSAIFAGNVATGNLDVTGDINLTGELNMIAGSDGQRFFDARVGSSALTFRGTTGGDANHQELARFFRGGGCELNHAGNKKFETNSDGIKTSGRSEVTGQYGSSHYISNTTNSVYGYTTMNHGGYMTISADEGNTGSGPAIRFRVGGGTVGLWRDGGGLCFNGDTAAANALDDYEEGSYTPSVDAWSGYTSVFGYYVKIGKLVNAWGAVEDPSSTTSGSAVQISLPYTSTANTHGLGGAGGVMTENVNLSSGIETVVYVKPNDSKFRIYHTTNSNWATVNGDDCNSSSYIYFHVTYYIS